MSDVIAVAEGLGTVHGHGEAGGVALAGVSAEFRRGEFTAVMGPSGSGRSTSVLTRMRSVDGRTAAHGASAVRR